MINPVFQNKSWVIWKKWRSLLFSDGLKKLSQPRELPNLVPWAIKDALGTRLASHFKWSLKYLEAVVQRCSVIKVFLEILGLAFNFIKKETLAQVLFSEFCEISKNIFS